MNPRNALSLLVLLAGCLQGCLWEPYPAVVRVPLEQRDLPAKIVQIFRFHHSAAVIQRAEGTMFKEKMTTYSIYFFQNGREFHMSFDSAGDVLVPAEVFAGFESQHPESNWLSTAQTESGLAGLIEMLRRRDRRRNY